MDRSGVGILQYYKSLNYAAEILRQYGVDAIESKEAHDFAMDCIVEKGMCNMKYIRMRIIDSLRRQYGRKNRRDGKKDVTRRWTTLTATIIDQQPEQPTDIDALLMQFQITSREHFVLSMICCGISQAEIGKMLGVSFAMISQIVIAAGKQIRESGVYNTAFYEKDVDERKRRKFLKRMRRPMRTWKVAHDERSCR